MLRASSTSSRASGGPNVADPEFVARDRCSVGGPGERAAVLREGGIHVVAVADRREGLDLPGDLRREEVGFAVAAEAREPGIRQASLAAGRRLGQGGRGVTASKLALGEVGEGRPARPGGRHREARRHDRGVEVDDVDERATDIRRHRADPHPCEGLAQPGFEGDARRSMVSADDRSSAPRVPASSAASSTASHGCTAVAPAAMTMAMEWTSRTSDASTRRSVRPRRPAAVNAVWTAPTARIDGIGSVSAPSVRSLRVRTSTPARAAATPASARRSSADSRPAGPSARSRWHRAGAS